MIGLHRALFPNIYMVFVLSLNVFLNLFLTGESKVVQIPATPCSPTSSSISSVTTQPVPRTDLFPPPFTYASPAKPASRPPSPPPDADAEQLPSMLLKEDDEDEEEEEEAQLPSETKHKTSKKDLLEIDRFTICGNRIDWSASKQPLM